MIHGFLTICPHCWCINQHDIEGVPAPVRCRRCTTEYEVVYPDRSGRLSGLPVADAKPVDAEAEPPHTDASKGAD